MRSRSAAARAFLVVVLTAVLLAPAAFADDPPPCTDSPQAKIRPPIGATADEETASFIELFCMWLQALIRPPIG